jgi:hypothetical protein
LSEMKVVYQSPIRPSPSGLLMYSITDVRDGRRLSLEHHMALALLRRCVESDCTDSSKRSLASSVGSTLTNLMKYLDDIC